MTLQNSPATLKNYGIRWRHVGSQIPGEGQKKSSLSNEKHPGCLGYIGDYTTQLCGDYFIQ